MATKKKDGEKGTDESVAETIKGIKHKFGEDSIMKLDQQPLVGIDSISTGSFGLDIALGIGGLPRGRIVEIYGPESSGKTTLSLHVIAEAQKTGGLCAFIDAEHALDPIYAKRIGVKTDELFICQPNNGEQGLEILESLVRSAKFAVVVVDSVATLTPKDEIEGNMGDQQMGRQARLMSQAMRKLIGIVSQSNTVVIFINQIRTSIGVAYGNPEYTPGGKALKFSASVRLDIRRIAKISNKEEVIGGRTRVKVVKNKVAPPFRVTEFDLMFNEGISRQGEILAIGEKFKVIKKVGNTYTTNIDGVGMRLGVGYGASKAFLKENKELSDKLVEVISKKLTLAIPEAPIGSEEAEVEPTE